MHKTSLGELAAATDGEIVEPSTAGVELTEITYDSRQASAGSLFCCVVGATHDGHAFAAAAVEAGAAALLVERRLDLDVAQIEVSSVRASMGPAAATIFDHPWRRCRVVGVTGTAGKTSVTHALAAIGNACGSVCEVIGTLDGPRTTPEAPDLYRRLDAAARDGVDLAVVEVSSHALELGRVDGARFAASVFTNLGHEHLDFHGSMERYFAAKAKLFDGRSEVAVVNTADPWGQRLASMASAVTKVHRWQPDDVSVDSAHGLRGHWKGRPVRCSLLGRINAANVAGAAATACALGYEHDDVARGISAIEPVRGRLWPVSTPADDVLVLVDFAHKPEALAATLSSARDLAASGGKVWAVFGAGGDRDQSKRALMGQAADNQADLMVITSDNPRSEDPAEIAAVIASGAPRRHGPDDGLHVELDRARAIALAIDGAAAGDVIVVAGKGHETMQIRGDGAVAFDDAKVSADLLNRRRERTP